MKTVDLLVEPFAGGASTSLRLVGNGAVSRILLADVDPLVSSFWMAAASDSENLIDRMDREYREYVVGGGARAVSRWEFWRSFKVPDYPGNSSEILDAATKCLFLNRTTFSGILHGRAGPVGGKSQESSYSIGCRFNPQSLAARIRYVAYLYESKRLVDVWQKDWKATLCDVPEWYGHLLPDRVLAYLDPPYIEKSDLLYGRSFSRNSSSAKPTMQQEGLLHQQLSEFLRKQMRMRWILSYDDHPAILSAPSLYLARKMTPGPEEKALLDVKEWPIYKAVVPVRYTAAGRGRRGSASELLISTLPIPNDSL